MKGESVSCRYFPLGYRHVYRTVLRYKRVLVAKNSVQLSELFALVKHAEFLLLLVLHAFDASY